MEKVYKKESHLQNDILILLGGYGYPAVNVIVASRAGESDIVACIEGRYCLIEVKLRYNEPSALQVRKQQKVRMAKGYAIIAKSLEDVLKLIEQVKKDSHQVP